MTIEDANGYANSYTGATTLTDPPILVVGGVSVTSNYNGEDISCNGAQMELLKLLHLEALLIQETTHYF